VLRRESQVELVDYVSRTGQVRLGVDASRQKTFVLHADLVRFTRTY
jgi:hypothetical protein